MGHIYGIKNIDDRTPREVSDIYESELAALRSKVERYEEAWWMAFAAMLALGVVIGLLLATLKD